MISLHLIQKELRPSKVTLIKWEWAYLTFSKGKLDAYIMKFNYPMISKNSLEERKSRPKRNQEKAFWKHQQYNSCHHHILNVCHMPCTVFGTLPILSHSILVSTVFGSYFPPTFRIGAQDHMVISSRTWL